MTKLYAEATPPTDMNRNTEWLTYPGVWTTYILIIFFAWIAVLSIFRCSAGIAWTTVNIAHFLITCHYFHWRKGTPFGDDQGVYNRLTWWEQMDNGKQLTRNRKFLTTVPVVLGGLLFSIRQLIERLHILRQVSLHKNFASTRSRLMPGWQPLMKASSILYSYLIASHTTDYQHPMLFLNTLAVFVLVIAKFPNMHKVRVFGINSGQ